MSDLNNDVSSEEARALHRVVRAMHDGNCPACGIIVDSADMRFSKAMNRFGHTGWRCPECSFAISEEEASAAMAALRPYMVANVSVFEKWRESRVPPWKPPAGAADGTTFYPNGPYWYVTQGDAYESQCGWSSSRWILATIFRDFVPPKERKPYTVGKDC